MSHGYGDIPDVIVGGVSVISRMLYGAGLLLNDIPDTDRSAARLLLK